MHGPFPNALWEEMSITLVIEMIREWLELMQISVDVVRMIKERLKATQHYQKNYMGKQHWPLEFEVKDHAFLKVLHWKGLIRFGMKEKLKLRYIGLFKIQQRIGKVTYRSALPPKLSHVHNIFHVARLRKFKLDHFHVINFNNIKLEEDTTYIE